MTYPKIIQHHEKYKELDGEDKIVLMGIKEHRTLQGERGFPIPKKIIASASGRSPCKNEYGKKYKKEVEFVFDSSHYIGDYWSLRERIKYNISSTNIQVQSGFQYNKKKQNLHD